MRFDTLIIKMLTPQQRIDSEVPCAGSKRSTVHGANRQCAVEGCITKLASFNGQKRCYRHQVVLDD